MWVKQILFKIKFAHEMKYARKEPFLFEEEKDKTLKRYCREKS